MSAAEKGTCVTLRRAVSVIYNALKPDWKFYYDT